MVYPDLYVEWPEPLSRVSKIKLNGKLDYTADYFKNDFVYGNEQEGKRIFKKGTMLSYLCSSKGQPNFFKGFRSKLYLSTVLC